jgi:hypothetical protein
VPHHLFLCLEKKKNYPLAKRNQTNKEGEKIIKVKMKIESCIYKRYKEHTYGGTYFEGG